MKIEYKRLPKGASHQVPVNVIVHSMGEYITYEGEVLHAYDFLKKIGLSAHALVCPDGTIIRCREDSEGAYHAKYFNTNTLGVEFLVGGTMHSYRDFKQKIKKHYLTFDQYCAGVELLRGWCSKHTITSIDRHSDIDPKRKIDPGTGFNFKRFIKDVNNA